jgi:heme-degrading monooxygenase HmoA
MVTVGMNYRVLPGKEAVFERAFKSVLAALEQSPGHSQSRLYRDVHDPQSYVIISEWSDRAVFEAFLRSEPFAKVTSWGAESILATRPTHKVYEE